MTGDPLRRLQAGERLDSIPASAWNAFVAAAEYVRAQLATGGVSAGGGMPGPGQVLILNDSGEDREQFDVLEIIAPVITAADNRQEFEARIVLKCRKPVADAAGAYVVLAEPIPAGQFGRAWIDGVCPARVKGLGAFADTKKDECGFLEAGGGGNARILWSEDGEEKRAAYIRLNDPALFYLVKTVAGPGDTPYPDEGTNPNVYRVQILASPSFKKEAGNQPLITSDVERFDYVFNLISDEYIQQGSKLGALPLNGHLFTMDKVTGDDDCDCGSFPVFVFGGASEKESVITEVEAYDPGSNAWKRVASLPYHGWIQHSTAKDPAGEQLYSFGGAEGSFELDNYKKSTAYTPLSDSYAAKADSPRSIYGTGQAAVAGLSAYFVNDTTGALFHLPANTQYTFAADTFAEKSHSILPFGVDSFPQIPYMLGLSCKFGLGGEVYAVTFQANGGDVDGTFAYNPITDVWSVRRLWQNANLDSNHPLYPFDMDGENYYDNNAILGDHHYVTYCAAWTDGGDKAYAHGGIRNGVLQTQTDRYSAGANVWGKVTSMPSPARAAAQAASVGGTTVSGFVLGGSLSGGATSNHNHQFDGATWAIKTPMIVSRAQHTAGSTG